MPRALAAHAICRLYGFIIIIVIHTSLGYLLNGTVGRLDWTGGFKDEIISWREEGGGEREREDDLFGIVIKVKRNN